MCIRVSSDTSYVIDTLQGDPGHKLYYVRSGLLQVRVAHNRACFRHAYAVTCTVEGCRNLRMARDVEDDALQSDGAISLLQKMLSNLSRSMRRSSSAQVRSLIFPEPYSRCRGSRLCCLRCLSGWGGSVLPLCPRFLDS